MKGENVKRKADGLLAPAPLLGGIRLPSGKYWRAIDLRSSGESIECEGEQAADKTYKKKITAKMEIPDGSGKNVCAILHCELVAKVVVHPNLAEMDKKETSDSGDKPDPRSSEKPYRPVSRHLVSECDRDSQGGGRNGGELVRKLVHGVQAFFLLFKNQASAFVRGHTVMPPNEQAHLRRGDGADKTEGTP